MTDERKNEIWAMLTQEEKTYIQSVYNKVTNDPVYVGYNTALAFLFGSHNLTTQAEEKPKEPKFKVGDRVRVMASSKPYKYGSIHTITELHVDQTQCEYLLEKSDTVWYDESSLAPYTEPKEDVETSDESDQNPLNVAENDKLSTKEDAYFAYRLDLAKEIAIALINNTGKDTPYGNMLVYGAVKMANEIVKRLKETDNENA